MKANNLAAEWEEATPIQREWEEAAPATETLSREVPQSFLKRAAGAVAPYARPVLEYGGAIGGGMAAAPGTFGLGTVAGAGLGYAAGRQAANALEEYAGTKQPNTLPQAARQAAEDVPTGAALEMGGQLVGKGLQAAGPYVRRAAERVYGSATKMPLSKKWVQTLPGREMSQRQMAVKAGLESKVPPSEFGLAKARKLEQEMRGAVDDILSEAAKRGRGANVDDVLKFGLPKAYARAAKSSDPVGAKQIVDDLAAKFQEHGPKIPVDKLNAIKRQLYDEVKWGGQQTTGLTGQITEDFKKGVAHEIMTRLEQQYPQIRGLNKQDAAYINLIEAIERTVGREQNKDIIGLGAKVLTVKNIPMAIIEQTIGHPQVKARIAFLLNKAAKTQGAPLISRGLAYGATKLARPRPAPVLVPEPAYSQAKVNNDPQE